jgi:ABC-type sugar transport system substrate-binding protein
VAVIGAQSGLLTFAAPPSVAAAVAATGSIGWIVGDLSEYLHDLRDFWAAAAAGNSGGGG